MPAIAAAVYALGSAISSAAPSVAAAAPFALASAVALGIVATHDPRFDVVMLSGKPETAVECIQRNAGAEKARLAALAQPAYGTAAFGIVFKRGGVTGDPVMSGLVREEGNGSAVEFKALAPLPDETELITRLTGGC